MPGNGWVSGYSPAGLLIFIVLTAIISQPFSSISANTLMMIGMIRSPFMILLIIAAMLPLMEPAEASSGVFTGNFSGKITGDRGSFATLMLNLSQNGSQVAGTAAIGDGLCVDTGGFICPGIVPIGDGTIGVEGHVSLANSRQLMAKSAIYTSGMSVDAEVLALLSQNSDEMTVTIRIKIPWPCRSPEMRADLNRQR